MRTKDGLTETEIAVLYATLKNQYKVAIKSVLSTFSENAETLIKFCTSMHSNSAEWPAVIVLHKAHQSGSSNEVQLSGLYQAISRARVHCSVILFPEEGKSMKEDCPSTLELLEQLTDVAQVVWH